MNEADAVDMVTAAIWTVLVASGPAVGAAMAIGIIIDNSQALTQLPDMTFTFIPKIFVIFVVLALTASFVGGQIYSFTQLVYGRIESSF